MINTDLLLYTQKILVVLDEMYKLGTISKEILCKHAGLKLGYLQACLDNPELSEYNSESIKILSRYRSILEELPFSCKTQV